MTRTAWPLTGRSTQLDAIHRHDRAGTAGGVVIHGPAGVGKTRLAEEALSRAEHAGRPTARAVGHQSMESIPLGALAHLLPASLVGGLGVGDDERTGLFHGARAELRRMAGDDRLVLLVDDLDLLDDTSLAVLVPLVVSRTAFLIGTVRTDRVGRAPSPRVSPVSSATAISCASTSTRSDPTSSASCCTAPSTTRWRPTRSTSWRGCRAETCRCSPSWFAGRSTGVRSSRIATHGDWWATCRPRRRSTSWSTSTSPASTKQASLCSSCSPSASASASPTSNVATALATLEKLEAGRLVSMVVTGRRTAVRLAHPLYGEVLRARHATAATSTHPARARRHRRRPRLATP